MRWPPRFWVYVGCPEDTTTFRPQDFDFYEPDVQGRTNLEYFIDGVLRGNRANGF